MRESIQNGGFIMLVLGATLTENVLSGSGTGGLLAFLFSFVSGIVIVGGTLIIIIHKSLNLVTWLPENVINWAGGHGSSLGEQSDERRVAGMVAGVGNMAKRQPTQKPGTPGAGGEKAGGDEAGGAADGAAKLAAQSNTGNKASNGT